MALSRAAQRRLAHGGNATAVTVAVVALLVILYGVLDRHRVRVDLTADRDNSLQEDTLKKISLVEQDDQTIEVIAFTFQDGKADTYQKNRAVQDLLTELDYASPFIETRFVDFDKERLTAEQLSVTEYGHWVVRRGDERVDLKARELFRSQGRGADKELQFLGEAAFNRATSQILSDRRKTLYVLGGHGEKSLGAGPDGLGDLSTLLDQENYELKALDLLRDRDQSGVPMVPSDASAVFVLGPTGPLTPGEDDALVAYVASGGAMVVAVDPGGYAPLLLDKLGISVPDGVVADQRVIYPYPDRPVVQYGRHNTTTELLERSMVTVLAHIAPIRMPAERPPWATEIFRTSQDGWVDRGGVLEVGGLARYEPEIDLAGPVSYGWGLEVPPGGGLVNEGKRVARVAVIGDSDLFTNELLQTGPGNATFAVNLARWQVWDDARLSMIGTPTAVSRLALSEQDQGRIRFVSVFLLPGLILLLGGVIWFSRRGR
jgi:hypothetical protein